MASTAKRYTAITICAMAPMVTYRLRCVEIKHGHSCKLTLIGQIIVSGGLHIPGNVNDSGESFDSFLNDA